MIASEIIQKKRDGIELKKEEIHSFIKGLSTGEVTDYQASAWLMASYFQGMTTHETVHLTEAMLASGDRYDLSGFDGFKIDKHSTGGVGDKVSLILAPLAAACGLRVPMMSGRGLGHSGGTLDKLESIPGFNVNLDEERFSTLVCGVGCAMIGQSSTIVPADKKLYALRDVTATVECIPLIVSSILSKKLAEGTEALVLDVKFGSGAFMKTKTKAKALASELLRVAKKMKLPCKAVLSSMEQPLGHAVGNSLEVLECISILKNEKDPMYDSMNSTDLKELTLHLCAMMLTTAKLCRSLPEARVLAQQKIEDGSAWQVFVDMVAAQDGSVEAIQDPLNKLPISKNVKTLNSPKRGYITHMDTTAIGNLLVELGGGRKKVTDIIDPSVGFIFHHKLGSKVKAGEAIATVYLPEKPIEGTSIEEIEKKFFNAIEIKNARKPVPKLIQEVK